VSDRHGIVTAYSGAPLQQQHGSLRTGLAALQRRQGKFKKYSHHYTSDFIQPLQETTSVPLVSDRCPATLASPAAVTGASKSFAIDNTVLFGCFA